MVSGGGVCVCVGVRLEETIYTRLEKAKPHRSETEELLGAELGKASSAFGDDASEYGERKRVSLVLTCNPPSYDMNRFIFASVWSC